jgi:glycosyltransferase involved in cell wall biosynthesis
LYPFFEKSKKPIPSPKEILVSVLNENLNQKPKKIKIDKIIYPKEFFKLKIFLKNKKEKKINVKYNKIDTSIFKKFIRLIKKNIK